MNTSRALTAMNYHISEENPNFRSSHQRCYIKKGVLRNFTKFTGKQLCQSLFKKETLAQVLSCEFCRIFTEYVWTTASEISKSFMVV